MPLVNDEEGAGADVAVVTDVAGTVGRLSGARVIEGNGATP
jgi:hypothetical protein